MSCQVSARSGKKAESSAHKQINRNDIFPKRDNSGGVWEGRKGPLRRNKVVVEEEGVSGTLCNGSRLGLVWEPKDGGREHCHTAAQPCRISKLKGDSVGEAIMFVP
jgi:hypothetical protein